LAIQFFSLELAFKFRQSRPTADTLAHVIDLVSMYHYTEDTTPSSFLTLSDGDVTSLSYE